jgi:hypothetical protein
VAQDPVFLDKFKMKTALFEEAIEKNHFSYLLKIQSFYVVRGTRRCLIDKFKTKIALFKNAVYIAK